MQVTTLFPQGHALGNAFCNREHERQRLRECFLNHEHTVLVAPRRYGKSSLIRQVLHETHIAGKRIDLLPATNVLFVQKALKSCCIELMNKIFPQSQTAGQRLIEFVKKLHPKLTFSMLGQKLEITTLQSPEESIAELLLSLNAAAKKMNQKCVICIDEFQQVGLLKNSNAIEAAIRHAVESSTHVTYIFSGSSRHLLSQMFSSKNRPLYHLCELMELKRITYENYMGILLEKAKNQWKKFNDEKAIQEILNLTKRHPYYVNALCRHLWKNAGAPTVLSAQKTWFDYVETQKNWITDDLARLSPNQRNILAALAYIPTSEPYAQEFCDRVKMGASSVKASLQPLLKDDFIYRENEYKIVDPALETYLHQIKYFDFIEN